jgi:outer membrane protein assembly factor BamB
MTHFSSRRAALALLALVLVAAPALAVITKLTPLAEVLESDQFIFVAKAEKLDPDKPASVFTVGKKLKGEPPFDRVPVNMTGDDEAKKTGDTKAMFERLDATRELVFFVRKQGKLYNAKVFVEGTWFSIYGQLDADGKTIRWAFLHGEPFLRRTFKGTTAEMVKTVEDAIAKKAKPPEPDEKEKPGYGPVIEKKKCDTANGEANETGGTGFLACAPVAQARKPVPPANQGSPLLGVIPSFVLVGPLAIVAALFPGVFARLAVGMKRWRAFLVVASVNSTLALVYWVFYAHFPDVLPSHRAFAPRAVTLYLTLSAFVGLLWAGRRYRRMAAEDASVTGTPGRVELLTLLGLAAFAGLMVVLTAALADWNSTLEIPMREFTFIGTGLVAALVYAGYRVLTKRADEPSGTSPAVRLSVSGESVALAALVLCGVATLVNTAPSGPAIQGAGTAQKGDATEPIGPRLVGEPVAIEVYELEAGKKEPLFGNVMSNMVIDGERLYFGVDSGGNAGRIIGANRTTGLAEFAYDAPGLLPVYCTPTLANGKVYCGEGLHENKGCRLFCVNAKDATDAWNPPFKTASHTEGAPAVANGKVYFTGGEDGLYCADANTGAKLWQFPGGKEKRIHIDGAPAVADGRVFVGSGLYSYVAVALDANTGEEKWRTDLKLRSFGPPTVSGGKVFYAVGTGNMAFDTYKYDEEGEAREKDAAGAVVCLDATSGKEEWRFELPKSVHTGLALDAYSAYVGCRDGYVYALDRKSGKLRWKTEVGAGQPVLSCPAVAQSGGQPVAVYAVAAVGLMVCLNPQTGEVVWQKQLPGFRWDGTPNGGAMCAPVVQTALTPTGSKRTIYVGARLTDPANPVKRTVAFFRFEDALGE